MSNNALIVNNSFDVMLFGNLMIKLSQINNIMSYVSPVVKYLKEIENIIQLNLLNLM